MRRFLCVLLVIALLVTPYAGFTVYAAADDGVVTPPATETEPGDGTVPDPGTEPGTGTEPDPGVTPEPEPEPEPEPDPGPVDPATLTSSREFIEILKKREGFEKYPYKDNSQWSIGYGTRVPDGKLDYYKKHGITEEEAEKLMMDMLADFEDAVKKMAAKYGLLFTQNQFDALVSFTYNCGDSWSRDTSGNMFKAVKEGWQGSDFLYAICLWSKSDGQFILINRRLYEAAMYVDGIYESPYDHEKGSFRYVYLEGGQGITSYVIHGYDIRDPKPIRYNFKSKPIGVDENGNSFTYEFDGWYTAPEGGRKVEILDDTLESGSLLYGRWKDPEGKSVYLPKGEGCDLKVTLSKVNEYVTVRKGPGYYYDKAGKLYKNETVTLTKVYDDGKFVWGEYKDGWIRLDYTDYDEVLAGTEVWPKTGTVNANGVNVRTGAGTSNSSVYKLNKGDAVTIHEKKKSGDLYWGRLDDGNWICLTYVDFDTVVTPPSEEPETPPQEPETPPEDEPEEESPWPMTGTVNGINVNVRSGPDTDEPMVYQVSTGTKVTIVESVVNGNLTWGRMEDDNWICLKYVIFGEDADPDDPPQPENPPPPAITPSADADGNGKIDKDDAIYLLRHVVYPDKYPLTVDCDVDGNGKLDKDDAIYLLRHVVYPDKYPLKLGE